MVAHPVAQRILAKHLRNDRAEDQQPADPPSSRFWSNIRLDLTGATLIDFDLVNGVMADASFHRAAFSGATLFGGAVFSGAARFGGAAFRGDAWFGEATFGGAARFGEAAFGDGADALHFEQARILSAGASHVSPPEWHLADADGGGYTVARADDDGCP